MIYSNRTILSVVILCSSLLHGSDKLPIVYSDDYNISFYGLENTTPFDTAKYGKVAVALKKRFGKNFYEPRHVISDEALLTVHDKKYLDSLKDRFVVARIAENSFLIAFPISIIERKLLYPMKLATQGTIDAALLAYENKEWAINLSGGYHHAERETGDGFCFFADIPLAMNTLWELSSNLRIFYIDTDAHQGNGIETIYKKKLAAAKSSPKNADLIIFDVYSDQDYPLEPIQRTVVDRMLIAIFKKMGFYDPTEDIKKRVNEVRPLIQHSYPLEVTKGRPTNDVRYLDNIRGMIIDLEKEVIKAKEDHKPLFIFYNAGTDPFNEDPVAWLGVSKDGLIKRDYMIWQFAYAHKIPIVMTLSGGYSYKSASIIADSITRILRDIWKIPFAPQEQIVEPQLTQPRSWYQYFAAWFK